VERLPRARTMGEAVLLPDGRVLIVNGAATGVAGYGNVASQVGQSNADNVSRVFIAPYMFLILYVWQPTFQPVIYDPQAAAGSRFSTAGLPNSTIARMYHSTASLLP
jgi:hypothetical protein